MTRGARYGENFSPMSHGSQSLKSSADNCTWVQLKSNELKDRKDVSCSENFITQTTETNDTMIGGFSNIELRKDSGIQDDDFDSAPVDEIYPESKKTVKKNPCLFCFYSITRPKSVILMILIVSVVLLLVFFAFALLPLRSRRIPIIPLTSAPPTTLGTIRVLLLGKFLSFFCKNLPV